MLRRLSYEAVCLVVFTLAIMTIGSLSFPIDFGSSGGGSFAGGSVGSGLVAPYYSDNSADPADAGVLRCGNNVTCVAAEKATPGADNTLLWNNSDVLVLGGSTSRVTVPAQICSNGVSGFGMAGDNATTGLCASSADVPGFRGNGFDFYLTGNSNTQHLNGTGDIEMVSGGSVGWTDQAANAGAQGGSTFDTKFARQSAGVVLMTNAASGGNSYSSTAGLKTLTETSATAFVSITIPTSSFAGGTVFYTIEANDASDFQARAGELPFAAVNKAGTATCTVGTVGAASEVVAVSSGTLTNTFTCANSSGNVTILANATSSLTQTTLRIRYFIEATGAQTMVAQ